VAAWPYDRKLTVFEAYLGERQHPRNIPGDALQKATYIWDIVSDYSVLCECIRRPHFTQNITWQALTPRYGYDIPQAIDDAGLSDQYEKCFDLSLALYSLLQQGGHYVEAQYATLFGHRVRWQLTHNARQAFRLHETYMQNSKFPEVQKLVQQMHERLGQVHPVLADAMQFVHTPTKNGVVTAGQNTAHAQGNKSSLR
jgi:hypothetical protein